MNIACLIFGILFTVCGAVFFCGKGHVHLDGWKSMSEQERSQIKIGALCRNAGVVMGIAGIGFIIAGFNSLFADRVFIWYMVAWFIGTGLDIRFITKSEHYKNSPCKTVSINKK